MQKYFDINENGHSIRCSEFYDGDIRSASNWVIATHGFGGNKDSKSIAKFAGRILSKYKNYGVVCFDWPCHGKDARNKLILTECLEYLDTVGSFLKNERGAQKLYNYSVSMGAYFTLLYIHENGDPYEKIALRCPAIRFSDVIFNQFSDDEKERFEKKGEVKIGWERKVLITKDFLSDITSRDVTKYEYFDDADRMLILHGTKDKMVPIADSEQFADNNVIEMIPVENADHPFTDTKAMDFAIDKIINFFSPGA